MKVFLNLTIFGLIWNRNKFNLSSFVDDFSPHLIFLSEPQLFACDLATAFTMFKGSYQCHLNSNDVFCPDLPLISRKPNGGTMAMWHHHLDPYIRVLPCPSSAVLPILLAVPGLSQSAHISVYLPTAGKDTEFLCALAALDTCIEQIKEDFSCPVYIRGDFNENGYLIHFKKGGSIFLPASYV